MPASAASPTTQPGRTSLGGMIRFLAGLALFAWILRSLIVAPFSIPTGSMLPTMAIGDYLFVWKWPYGFSRHSFPMQIPSFEGRMLDHLPTRGDVVVFKRPDAQGADWVKRVIGLPGDTVAVANGVLVLNGRPVPRRRIATIAMPISPNSPCRFNPGLDPCPYPAFRETLPNGRSYVTLDQVDDGPADDVAPRLVTPGHLFLMGDNRDDSLDSRFSLDEGGIGLVPTDRLVGRAAFAFWSTDGSASYWKPWTWFGALRWGRIGTSYQS